MEISLNRVGFIKRIDVREPVDRVRPGEGKDYDVDIGQLRNT